MNETARKMSRRQPVRFTELDDEADALEEIPDLRLESQPELVMEREECSRLVRKIVAELPEQQHLILGMHYCNAWQLSSCPVERHKNTVVQYYILYMHFALSYRDALYPVIRSGGIVHRKSAVAVKQQPRTTHPALRRKAGCVAFPEGEDLRYLFRYLTASVAAIAPSAAAVTS